MQCYFFIETGKRFVKISYADIIYIEACRNYARLVTPTATHMVLISMRRLESLLPGEKFCRIHRSYIVAIASIESFVSDKVYVPNRVLPIGASYGKSLRQKILIVGSEMPCQHEKCRVMNL
jgi:DNA-binding LytR/AlgR family response regulator